jgi:hypothetical protein
VLLPLLSNGLGDQRKANNRGHTVQPVVWPDAVLHDELRRFAYAHICLRFARPKPGDSTGMTVSSANSFADRVRSLS